MYLGIGKLPGETVLYQFIIWFFVKMMDRKVIKIFFKVYSKI